MLRALALAEKIDPPVGALKSPHYCGDDSEAWRLRITQNLGPGLSCRGNRASIKGRPRDVTESRVQGPLVTHSIFKES